MVLSSKVNKVLILIYHRIMACNIVCVVAKFDGLILKRKRKNKEKCILTHICIAYIYRCLIIIFISFCFSLFSLFLFRCIFVLECHGWFFFFKEMMIYKHSYILYINLSIIIVSFYIYSYHLSYLYLYFFSFSLGII